MNNALGIVRSTDDLRNILRRRVDELGISLELLDAIAGLPTRYSAKLIGVDPVKGFGPISFEGLLGATGLMLVAVEDTEATARIKSRSDFVAGDLHMRRQRPRITISLTRAFMRKIGAIGRAKRAEKRNAIAARKKARSEIYRQNALKRWRKPELVEISPSCAGAIPSPAKRGAP